MLPALDFKRPKKKPPHPTEIWAEAQIARAEYFTVVSYSGGVVLKIPAPTLAEVVAAADREQIKRPMFYAVTKGDHLSVFVKDARERVARESAPA